MAPSRPTPTIERPSDSPRSADADQPTFADLGINKAMCAELARQGITSPFPIQVKTLPDSLKGRDVLLASPNRPRPPVNRSVHGR